MLDSALMVWREEVRRRPAYAFGLMFVVQGLYWHQLFDSAVTWADSALAIDGTFVTAKDIAGQAEVERGNFARAIADFDAYGRLGTDVDAIRHAGERPELPANPRRRTARRWLLSA